MSTVDDIPEPVIPSRRLAPKDHLKRAASAPVASDAERYHLAAANAEALARIQEFIPHVVASLDAIVELLTRKGTS